ncbi:sulfate ABC transporter substrate-binding protein, partial [Streptomyces sp. NPDC056257]
MPATTRSTRTTRTLRRGVVAAALPLLIGALASCGYGSEAKKDDGDKAANAAATDGAKLSASEVR